MNNNIKGILVVIVGMLFFIIQDTLIKLTVNDLSLLQILVFRAAVGTIILVCYLIYKKLMWIWKEIIFSFRECLLVFHSLYSLLTWIKLNLSVPLKRH